jgi:hypothetical protein
MPHPKEADVQRLLEAGFAALSRVLDGRNIPHVPVPWLDPRGTETFEVTRAVFDASVVVSEINRELAAEPAITELAEIAARDVLLSQRLGRYGAGGSVAPKDEFAGIVLHHVMLLFQEYVKAEGTTDVNSARFARFWKTYRDELFRDTHRALRQIWVVNLGVERAYQLSPNLILRPVSAADQQPVTGFMAPVSILEVLTTIKNNNTPDSRTQDEDDLDVALALLYGTLARGAMLRAFSVGYMAGGGFAGGIPYATGPVTFLQVTGERAAELVAFLRLVKAAQNDRVVAIAMRRYVSARQRQSPEDALIDYWIALESLFGTGTAELTFRMSLRIAAFIESEAESRRARFESASESYKYRSLLVHGERGRPSKQLLESTDEMVKLSLYKICHSPNSYHPTTLEQDLLGGKEIATEGLTLVPPPPTPD